MSYERWMNYIRNAEKTLFCSGKIRKFHYKFNDDKEMIEEYNIETGILMRRAWKKKQNIMGLHTEFNELNGSFFDWDIELGEIIRPTFDSNFLVKETDIMPILTKRITRHNIEWRIRNLSYPIETYLIKVDNAKRSIVIRTTNKKYFKEIHVPELSRCNLLPQLDAMSIIHQHNTLIITVL
ncbi:protein DPCD isoform X2 [Sitodiplosis mosellana]|uniref:protein DPCD isoform X2 n=1 Tax=Sitodiplosis mosellana TaxID=263140 RepID=UPI002443D913|nr:protein DPCD isoform X2 [Sitodiplosis mosellana]